MIYSVFDYDRKVYDYYEGDGPKGTHAGAPPIRRHAALGATPDQASWTVPMSATKIGSGPLPKGRIATRSSFGGLGDSITDTTTGKFAIGAVAAYALWKIFGRKG